MGAPDNGAPAISRTAECVSRAQTDASAARAALAGAKIATAATIATIVPERNGAGRIGVQVGMEFWTHH
jgi:hypothetical protein